MTLNELKTHVRTVVDWPEPGVRFRDVTPLFETPECFKTIVNTICQHYEEVGVDRIAGVDARGFVIGGAVANQMNLPFVLVRKKGKLPFETVSEDYSLEYGKGTIEVHVDSVQKNERIAIVDDLIATGGTLLAASKLFQRLGAEVVEVTAVIDLPELGGSKALKAANLNVMSLIEFSESE
ncbi:MAG: adenine phosphoribosyltransferase [Verrucomicrobia bacterium]|nr:adenine phosphoribosyltransferase [Verrucomicrobiota bacterium]MDA1067902.1 adenine phosphoribosyltransferase [Verrucomicrobiota bacterium]